MPLPLYTIPSQDEAELQQRVLAILKAGWCQGQSYRNHKDEAVPGDNRLLHATRACLLGACDVAVGEDNQARYGEAISFLAEVIVAQSGSHYGSNTTPNANGCTCIRWNDAPARTKDEVLALLDSAITLARKRETDVAVAQV